MAFGIPSDNDNPEHWKVEGWRVALQQARTLQEVIVLECDLNRRVAAAGKRRMVLPYGRELQRMVMDRWNEIAAELGIETRRQS
jgi:hypothetical protein